MTRRLKVFNLISLDGFIADLNGDMSWAHRHDPEWLEFVQGNAQGGGEIIFGRITYDMMAGYWPTPMAAQQNPSLAQHMNEMPKVVFSRTLNEAAWNNTRLFKGDVAGEVRKLKNEPGKDMVIFGSGTIVSQLAEENLIDDYQLVACPIVLGKGKSMFHGVTHKIPLKLTQSRTFGNGNVVSWYQPTT